MNRALKAADDKWLCAARREEKRFRRRRFFMKVGRRSEKGDAFHV